MARKQAKHKQGVSREERRRRLKQEIKAAEHRAWQLMQDGLFDEAAECLEQLDRRVPRQPEILQRLLEVYQRLGLWHKIQAVAAQLVELKHDSADFTLLMAGACLTNLRLASALVYFERFVSRWPKDPRAEHVRETIASIENQIVETAADAGVPRDEARQFALDHETILDAIAAGKFAQAEGLARVVHERFPRFAPLGNNLADAIFYQGRFDESLEVERTVLEHCPDNAYGLANMVRLLCLLGRTAQAGEYAERLRGIHNGAADTTYKQMEAFSYLGLDDAVLEKWEELERAPHGCDRPTLARGHHLAAVALARLDRDDEARGHWSQARELDPDFNVASDNLKDSWQSAADREGPWAFSAPLWTSPQTIAEYRATLLDADGRAPSDFAERARRLVDERPEVAAIAAVILDRGDPALRTFFLELAIAADTPEMRRMLERFALDKRGSDRQRTRALLHLNRVNALSSKRARVWNNGEWHEVLVQEFDVHDEPTPLGDPQAEDLSEKAYYALLEDDGETAEKLLKQAMERVPDDPSLEFNLAQAYELQGRLDEARDHRRWVRGRWPDYLFGRVLAAHDYIAAGDFEAADAELAPLRDRQRFHRSEFSAFMFVQVRLFKERGKSAAARSWFDLWKRSTPDDRLLDKAQAILAGPRLGALRRMLDDLLPPE